MSQVEDSAPEPIYGRILVWAMRLMAVLWFAKGLQNWAIILGIGHGPDGVFEQLPIVTQSATAFFAVVDLVAAVGLWMAAPWGGVIWLVAAIAYASVDLSMPIAVMGSRPLLVGAIGGLIVAYLFITFMAAREGSIES